MTRIHILAKEEAQKIAAGEVIERPASAMKELLENSIDAGASQISLYIEKAGKQLIRIVDDGHGMSQEDTKICFHPHATSKISNVSELSTIDSFGFRGEALGSIASISKVTLETKQKNDKLGIKLDYVGGQYLNEQQISCSKGLDLQIRDLFFNIPARKKFLKQDETEWNHINSLFNSFALSHLNIHFKLYKEAKLILNAPKVDSLKSRISQVFGHNFSENLIPIIDNNGPVQIQGLISNHQFWRYNKANILFFVNKRLVKNFQLSNALVKGYLNVLPPNKFPAGVVFLDIDKTTVDINVHPRKEEVQFSQPLRVENAIKAVVKETLEGYISKQIKPSGEISEFDFDSNPFVVETTPYIQTEEIAPSFSPKIILGNPKPVIQEQFVTPKQAEISHNPDIKIIGQILQTYILIEQKSSLVIVDQHAAHERILYEQFSNKFEGMSGTQLLFPEIAKLDSHLVNLVIKEKVFFNKIGIELEQFGNNEIAIKSSPPKLHANSLKEFVLEIAHFMEENEHLPQEEFRKKITEHTHSHMSCKAAVRAGDILTHKEMLELVSKLQTCNNRLICAHGRPTIWTIGQSELEKKFKRKL